MENLNKKKTYCLQFFCCRSFLYLFLFHTNKNVYTFFVVDIARRRNIRVSHTPIFQLLFKCMFEKYKCVCKTSKKKTYQLFATCNTCVSHLYTFYVSNEYISFFVYCYSPVKD